MGCKSPLYHLPFPSLVLLARQIVQRLSRCLLPPCSPWLRVWRWMFINKTPFTNLYLNKKKLLTLVLVNGDLILSCCRSRPSRGSNVPWCVTHVQPNWRIAQPWIPSMRILIHLRWNKFEQLMRRQQRPTEKFREKSWIRHRKMWKRFLIVTSEGSSPKKNGLSASNSERVVKSSLPNSTISSGLWTPIPWAFTIFEAYKKKIR